MRQIEWDQGTVKATKERASAVAWAFNRLGRKAWVGKNVTQAITDYLVEQGYNVDRSKIRNIMVRLVKDNYAYERHSDNQRSIVEFGFLPDVDLTGHSLPKIKADTMTVTQGVKALNEVKNGNIPSMPPLPGQPLVSPYRLDELTKRLESWHQNEPEVYSSWVDAAIESLEANT